MASVSFDVVQMVKCMSSQSSFLKVVPALVLGAFALTGCIESATYGTGKTQEAQLAEDLTGIFGGKERERIEYVERPNIVRPNNATVLPTPETNVATNGQLWPESPDARLQRLREDLQSPDAATRGAAKRELTRLDNDKRDGFRLRQRERFIAAGIDPDKTELTRAEERALFLRLRDQRRGRTGFSNPNRRYLTEPPTTYREPYSTAAAGSLGLTEKQKQACLQTKGRSGIFGGLRGRSKKKQCAEYLASLNLVEPQKTQ